jgi:PGF-CTERM protein
MTVFKLLGQGSLQGSDAAEALVQAINDPNVDDTYTKLQFLVEEPLISFVQIGDKRVGEKFTIVATTNLAVGDEIFFETYSSSFKPTDKSQSGEFSGQTGTYKVEKNNSTIGSGMNIITVDVDTSTFKPDEYVVKAEAIVQDVTGSTLFNVVTGEIPTPTPAHTLAPVSTPQVPLTLPPTAVPTTEPTKTPTQPGFGALVALVGLGAVAFLVSRRD